MDSAAEGRPLAIFGWPGRALLPSRIRFWYSFLYSLGYVGRRILCAGACARSSFLCLWSTPESGFYAQARVPGVLFSNPDSLPKCYFRGFVCAGACLRGFEFAVFDILGGTLILIVYQYLRVPG